MPAVPRRILIAPDSFKGTFTAPQVAEAMAGGLRSRRLAADMCPIADGGEGTLAILHAALGGELAPITVSDPLGRPIEASFALVPRRRGAPLAIVEAAAASGLTLVSRSDRDPLRASTRGTGELIAAAVRAGAALVYVGVGGSATTDGGAGALEAIREAGGLGRARLVVLCDVRTRFEDAARVFGPQKGADPDQVGTLARRLHRLAGGFARDPRGVAMTGAAGGLSGGLWAELGAELLAGAGLVLGLLDFDRRMLASRAVVSGEGRLDRQSLAGKALSEVATRARQSGVPCYAIVGRSELDGFGRRILDLRAVLEAGTLEELQAAGARLADLL